MVSLKYLKVLIQCQTFKIILVYNKNFPNITLREKCQNNRLFFKIKDGYKLELETPETMKLFDSNKKLIDKTKMEKMYRVLKWLK